PTTRGLLAAASVMACQVPSREPSSTSTISLLPPMPSSTAWMRRRNSGSTSCSLKQGATTESAGRVGGFMRASFSDCSNPRLFLSSPVIRERGPAGPEGEGPPPPYDGGG